MDELMEQFHKYLSSSTKAIVLGTPQWCTTDPLVVGPVPCSPSCCSFTGAVWVLCRERLWDPPN